MMATRAKKRATAHRNRLQDRDIFWRSRSAVVNDSIGSPPFLDWQMRPRDNHEISLLQRAALIEKHRLDELGQL